MSLIILNVDEVRRTLSASGGAFVVHDKEVDIVRFAINSGFADIVLDGQVALRVMYQRPGETEVRAKTLTYYDTDGLRNYYDWQLAQSDLAKNGSLMVALCILNISGGEVSEWHTTPCAVRVLPTIHTDDSDEGDDTITPTVKERVAVLESMIQRVASGAPIVVASTSAMTDTDQIYVLSTDGNWYYHNGTAWTAGGEYGAVATDTTLTQSGIPADAKVTGDEISAIKDDLSDITSIGKNLFNKNNANIINAAASTAAPLKYRSNSAARTVWIECEPNTTYTVSKQTGSNFIVAYGSALPVVEAEIEYSVRYAANSAITVTTSATAKYLSALVWTTGDSITLDAMLNTVQFEKGSIATDYAPYKITADDEYARSILSGMQKHLSVTTDYLEAVTGDEIFSDFENMTSIGEAVYNNGKWQLPEEGGVSKTVNIQGGTTYLITLGVDLDSIVVSDYSTNYIVNPLTVTLGNATLDIFAYVDANWLIALTPTASSTGDVTFSVQCNGKLALDLESVSIKPVLQYADNPITENGIDIGGYDTNFVAGNGQKKTVGGNKNVAIGKNAQLLINTGYANTAVGYDAQRSLKNGRANTAIGHRAQTGLTTGMYNNAIGTVSQGSLTSGCWNNAMGNETQRDTTTGCNNVAIGRRAQSFLTTGNHNIAIGAMAGFNRFGTTGGHGAVATKTATGQVLIGGEATQKSDTEANYLIAIGYQACGNEKGVAIGAMAEANGEKSVAIGYGVRATNDHEVVIGDDDSTVVIAGKRITFNQDGTVTWESN